MISNEFRQSHFEIIELVLPYCTTCEPLEGVQPFHTPLTCKNQSDAEYSLFFCKNNAPIGIKQPSPSIGIESILNSSIFRCVTNYSENTTKLKGEGLASRGTASITLADFSGDPMPIFATDSGTFFGKLLARNVLQGKKVITHYYAIVGDKGNESTVKIGQSIHFITSAQLSNGALKISAKDALKDAEQFSQKFPQPTNITLTSDVDDVETQITVTSSTGITSGSVLRVGAELMFVESVSGSTVTVGQRGASLVVGGIDVYSTDKQAHSAGDSVQLCYVAAAKGVADVISDIFTSSGLADYDNNIQWSAEVDQWVSNADLTCVFSKPESVSSLLSSILESYMLSMWLDQSTQKANISAVSAWRFPKKKILEGDDFNDISINNDENSRFSRALMLCVKPFQARQDDEIEYLKSAYITDVISESSDMHGSVKLKDFGMIPFISKSSAEITASRYVQRYSKTPQTISMKMEERKLHDIAVSDVVDIVSRGVQNESGEYKNKSIRAQIVKIQPDFSSIGRMYNVTALSYIPLITTSGSGEITITITGTAYNVDVFARAGAPSKAVTVNVLLINAEIGSNDKDTPSMRAGEMPEGSTVNVYFTENSKMSGKGGNGGIVSHPYLDSTPRIDQVSAPEYGSDSYQSDGITTNMYVNYNTDKYKCSGSLIAASGGSNAALSIARTGGAIGSSVQALSYFLSGGANGIPSGHPCGMQSYFNDQIVQQIYGGDGGFDFIGKHEQVLSDESSFQGLTARSSVDVILQPAVSSVGATTDTQAAGSRTAQTGLQTGERAGGSIKGSNVTVYNTIPSRFTTGNSDNFTLVQN